MTVVTAKQRSHKLSEILTITSRVITYVVSILIGTVVGFIACYYFKQLLKEIKAIKDRHSKEDMTNIIITIAFGFVISLLIAWFLKHVFFNIVLIIGIAIGFVVVLLLF